MSSDLISRSKAKEAITGWDTNATDEELELAIDRLPAVDAVEVVRCKDCYFGKLLNSEMVLCVEEKLFPTRTSPDFFCASGKCKTVAEVEG